MSKPSPRLAFLVALTSGGWAAAQSQESAPPAPPPSEIEAGGSEAQPETVGLYFAHVESTNLARTAAEIAGSYEGLGLLLGLEHASPRLDAAVNANLEYRHYALDDIENDFVGTLNAAAEIDLVRDHFSWVFSDAFGQGLTDPFGGIGPVNREEINVIGTGPRVDLPLGARMSLEIRGTYSERRFNESANVDSDALLSEVILYRQLSSTARVGIVAGSNDVEYVDVLAPRYQIDHWALHYEKRLATGRVAADLGQNEIGSGGFTQDGPLYSFLWTRSLRTRSELSVRAARELTDAGGVLADAVVPGPEGTSLTDVIVIPNPLEQQRLGVTYVLTMSRNVVSAEIGSLKDEYIGTALYDNDARTMHLQFLRTISPRLNLGIAYDDIDRKFSDAAGPQPDSDDSWIAVWLNHSLGRRMSLGFAISNYVHSSIGTFDERRYELRFSYSPTDSAAATMSSIGR